MNRWRNTRALMHPLWWSALFLLVVNDHVLKGAGVLPGIFTGKLSDVAGLVVAPWLLALLVRVESSRGALLAHAATGAGLAAINLSPTLAHLVERVTAKTPFAWSITVDPTDLVALPALALSFGVLSRAAQRQGSSGGESCWARPLRAAGVTIGLLACVATSRPPVPEARFAGALFLISAIPDLRVVTTRALRADVLLDCDFVAQDPSRRLSEALFDVVQTWSLGPDGVVPLQASRAGECEAWLIGGGGSSGGLVFARAEELPAAGLFTLEDLQRAPERTLELRDDGGGPHFSEHPLLFAMPPLELPRGEEGCEVLPPGSIAWSEDPALGAFELVGKERSPDGCYALDLRDQGGEERLFICLPEQALPFVIGESIEVSARSLAEGRGLTVAGESVVLDAFRGARLAGAAPLLVATPRAGCAGRFSPCGSLLLPVDVVIDDGGESRALHPGAPLSLASGALLHLATAHVTPVRDPSCETTSMYLESFSFTERH